MKFNPRTFVKTGIQKKNPVQRIDRWNPPVSESPITVTNSRIEPNVVSNVGQKPFEINERKRRG